MGHAMSDWVLEICNPQASLDLIIARFWFDYVLSWEDRTARQSCKGYEGAR